MARKKTISVTKSTSRRSETATVAAPEAPVAPPEADEADIDQDASGAAEPAAETDGAEALQDPRDAAKSFGKRELIDRVVAASGIKKKAAKPVVEAMLMELGQALSRGETLNLQPFGKGIIKAQKTLENAEVIELRLRRSKLAMAATAGPSQDEEPALAENDPLAAAAE